MNQLELIQRTENHAYRNAMVALGQMMSGMDGLHSALSLARSVGRMGCVEDELVETIGTTARRMMDNETGDPSLAGVFEVLLQVLLDDLSTLAETEAIVPVIGTGNSDE